MCGAGEGAVTLLGGLPVFVAELGGDLLPCCAGVACCGDELVLTLVKCAALGGDGAEFAEGAADGGGPGWCQRDIDSEQRDGAEGVAAGPAWRVSRHGV